MINLLPEERKRDIRAGRVNVLLLRYVSMIISGIVLVTVLLGGTFVVLNTSRENAQQRVDATRLEVASYDETKKMSEQFRKNLTTAKTILDNEINYSALIYKIADVVPKNVILDNLDLDSQTLGSKATMNASAVSYADAIHLKNAFEDDHALFSDVYFESITSNSDTATEDGADPYPVKVTLSVIIKKDAL